MFKSNLFKSFCIITLYAGTFIAVPSVLFSESVFMKNGAIAEGRISGGDDKKISINLISGETINVDRKDILRVLVHSRYKDKIYLTKTDGVTFEGYIVNEDNEIYILRAAIDSADEIRIPRESVETISTKKASERLLPPSIYSSVFLKDGAIIDCHIVKESDKSIDIQPSDGGKRVIPRSEIMRIQYNNSYKDKKILKKTDGTRIEGYIMEEDSESYTYRAELYSPVEAKIYKSELRSISRR